MYHNVTARFRTGFKLMFANMMNDTEHERNYGILSLNYSAFSNQQLSITALNRLSACPTKNVTSPNYHDPPKHPSPYRTWPKNKIRKCPWNLCPKTQIPNVIYEIIFFIIVRRSIWGLNVEAFPGSKVCQLSKAPMDQV